MSTGQDFDRIVDDWLEVGPTQLSERVTVAARRDVHRTKQRRPIRELIARPDRRTARLLATAAGLVVLVGAGAVGLRLLEGRDAIGVPPPTPSATIAPSASALVPARLEVLFHVRSSDLFHVPSTASAYQYPDAAGMAAIRDIVLRRLQSAGFVDPVVTLGDRDTVIVDLPLGTDWKQVRTLLEQRGELTIVPLPPDTYGSASTTAGPTGVSEGQPLPADPNLEPLFTGAAITAANPASDQGGSPAVEFTLDAAASKLFADYTANHVGDYFAIVLDGTVISAPSIRESITGGSGIITLAAGADGAARASELVSFLRIGALPFKLDWAGNGITPSPSP